MSTDYTLKLSAPDGSNSEIKVIDIINPLPGSDKWQAQNINQWGTRGGAVSSWGSGGAYLEGPYGIQSIFLEGFGKSTEFNSHGTGQKNYEEGSFPSGEFEWVCVEKV